MNNHHFVDTRLPSTAAASGRIFYYGLLLLLCSLIAYGLFEYRYRGLIEELRESQAIRLHGTTVMLVQELDAALSAIRVLYASVVDANLLHSQDASDIDALAQHLLSQVGSLANIAQVRWIDQYGIERVRFNISRQGEVVAVTGAELQDKSSRYYFREGMNTPPPKVHLSAIDLNVDHGIIEEPYRPTIRASLRTGGADGLADGLLIINYDLERLLRSIRQLDDQKNQVLISNSSGYWISHPDPEQTWGFVFDRPQARLQRQQPAVWQAMALLPAFAGFKADHRLWSYQRFQPGADIPQQLLSWPETLYLLVATQPDYLPRLTRELMWPALGIWLLLLLVGGAWLHRDFRLKQLARQLQARIASEQSRQQQLSADVSHYRQRLQAMEMELFEGSRLTMLGVALNGTTEQISVPASQVLISTRSLQDDLSRLKGQLAQGLGQIQLEQQISAALNALQQVRAGVEQIAETTESCRRLARTIDQTGDREFYLHEIIDDLLRLLSACFPQPGIRFKSSISPELRLYSCPGALLMVVQGLVLRCVARMLSADQQGLIHICDGPSNATSVVIDIGVEGRETEAMSAVDWTPLDAGSSDTTESTAIFLALQGAIESLGANLLRCAQGWSGPQFRVELPRRMPARPDPVDYSGTNS